MSPLPLPFNVVDDQQNGNDTSPGDFYYRVLRGIPGSAMENFGTRLRVDDIWRVVLFLKTIPNGGLLPKKTVTPDMYVQWKPNPDVLKYVKEHPVTDNKDFTQCQRGRHQGPLHAPGAARARRALDDRHDDAARAIGEISLNAAARDIKKIYDKLLDEEWAELPAARGRACRARGAEGRAPRTVAGVAVMNMRYQHTTHAQEPACLAVAGLS